MGKIVEKTILSLLSAVGGQTLGKAYFACVQLSEIPQEIVQEPEELISEHHFILPIPQDFEESVADDLVLQVVMWPAIRSWVRQEGKNIAKDSLLQLSVYPAFVDIHPYLLDEDEDGENEELDKEFVLQELGFSMYALVASFLVGKIERIVEQLDGWQFPVYTEAEEPLIESINISLDNIAEMDIWDIPLDTLDLIKDIRTGKHMLEIAYDLFADLTFTPSAWQEWWQKQQKVQGAFWNSVQQAQDTAGEVQKKWSHKNKRGKRKR